MSIALTLKGDESRTYMPWSQEEADYVGQYFMTNVRCAPRADNANSQRFRVKETLPWATSGA